MFLTEKKTCLFFSSHSKEGSNPRTFARLRFSLPSSPFDFFLPHNCTGPKRASTKSEIFVHDSLSVSMYCTVILPFAHITQVIFLQKSPFKSTRTLSFSLSLHSQSLDREWKLSRHHYMSFSLTVHSNSVYKFRKRNPALPVSVLSSSKIYRTINHWF